jgi:hypothetical protein
MESVNKPFEARLKALAGSISTQYKRLHTHTHTPHTHHTHTHTDEERNKENLSRIECSSVGTELAVILGILVEEMRILVHRVRPFTYEK